MRKLVVLVSSILLAVGTMAAASTAQAGTYAVSAKLSKSWMTEGTTVTISGKLTPASASKTVTIQRWISGAWVNSKTTKTNSKGAYSTTLKPGMGKASYRAKTAAKGSTKAGKSGTVTVMVYRWQDLAEIPTGINISQMYHDGGTGFGLDINGTQFVDDAWASLASGAGSTEWDLQKACIRVTGKSGLDDTSEAGSIGTLTIQSASGEYNRTMNTSSPMVTVTENITGSSFLEISSTRDEESASGADPIVGYGQPRVLCSKDLLD